MVTKHFLSLLFSRSEKACRISLITVVKSVNGLVFISLVSNAVIKFPIYFALLKHIDGQIIVNFTEMFHVFIQVRGTYKH